MFSFVPAFMKVALMYGSKQLYFSFRYIHFKQLSLSVSCLNSKKKIAYGSNKSMLYGMSNFAAVMGQNCYYVDKTMYLPMLEDQPHYLIFIRPRRFGKSLFGDMLRSYYDLSQKRTFSSCSVIYG